MKRPAGEADSATLTSLVERIRRGLHPWWRSAAIRSLEGRALPAAIWFICQGNLYRSPFAAATFASALPWRLRALMDIRSAGFISTNRPAPPEAVQEAAARGYDLSGHRSVLIPPEIARPGTLLVVMDPVQRRGLASRLQMPVRRILVLGDLDPLPSSERAITDPRGLPGVTLADSYERIERCTRQLAALLGRSATLHSGQRSSTPTA